MNTYEITMRHYSGTYVDSIAADSADAAAQVIAARVSKNEFPVSVSRGIYDGEYDLVDATGRFVKSFGVKVAA